MIWTGLFFSNLPLGRLFGGRTGASLPVGGATAVLEDGYFAIIFGDYVIVYIYSYVNGGGVGMENGGRRKLFLIGVILVAVCCIGIGWFFTLRDGVYIGDDFYYQKSKELYQYNKLSYVEMVSDSLVRIVYDGEEREIVLAENGSELSFSFSDGEYVSGFWNRMNLVDSEGIPLGFRDVRVVVNGESVKPGNISYCEAICKIRLGDTETRSEWYLEVVGLFFYILGIMSMVYPDKMHFFLKRWAYNNPELSESGRVMEQIGGGFVAIMGIVLMSGVLFLIGVF